MGNETKLRVFYIEVGQWNRDFTEDVELDDSVIYRTGTYFKIKVSR
jgi:hypothetical protein